jgi:hypothetical protein
MPTPPKKMIPTTLTANTKTTETTMKMKTTNHYHLNKINHHLLPNPPNKQMIQNDGLMTPTYAKW